MEALNGSAFLPLLVVLGSLGLKISWFPIRIVETDLATNVGLWQIRSRPCFGGRSVPWCGTVPFRPDYVPSSPKNVRARARRVRDIRLWERRLARAQSLLRDLHFDGDDQGNGSDESLDGWIDE